MKLLRVLIGFATLVVAGADVGHAADKHLFYLHGCCIKGQEDPKVKAYETIVQQLRSEGFNVRFDLRYSTVGDSDAAAQAHAASIAGEVRTLLARGIAPGDITVAGYSLGSMTALVASGLIANPRVNFVLLAGCPINPAVRVQIDYSRIQGRVLSIYDTKDEKFGSCRDQLPQQAAFREIVLNSGKGHAVFRLPDEKHASLWKAPLLTWTTGN